jgi:hypothetical protein
MSAKEDSENLVSVYKTSNPAIIALVKSMLDEAGIEYMAKGDDLAGVYPINAFPVDFQVMPESEEYARELLKDVNTSEPIDENNEEEENNNADEDNI